ncbi:class I SAM-dependent methyltransferase [Zavarzinia sp.]|uniref:class I SAM-dependent methyltransferase n=1 Tax=Zavarzinia sp. TaxID=2027920 RepID=UPI003563280C
MFGRKAVDDLSDSFKHDGHAVRAPSMLLKWLRSPFKIGAVAPSSRGLAREMAAQADLSRPGPVIELGGGTGAITTAILERVGFDRLFSVEFDPELAQTLRHRFPRLHVVEGDACELVQLMAARGVDRASCVISGLPLLGMPPSVQRRIVESAFALMGPGGRFVQFTYGPTSPLRPNLVKLLGLRARRAGHVLMNMPPARVWCYENANTNE